MDILYVASQVAGWLATIARASGMLAKSPKSIKLLVSLGNAGWLVSGLLTKNIPLIVSNAICLIVVAVEFLRTHKKEEK